MPITWLSMTDTAPPFPPDLKSTLEEMRASAARAKGVSGAIQRALFRLLEALMTLLAELRARRVADADCVGEVAPAPARNADAASLPQSSPARAAGAVAYPSHSPRSSAGVGPSPRVKPAGKPALKGRGNVLPRAAGSNLPVKEKEKKLQRTCRGGGGMRPAFAALFRPTEPDRFKNGGAAEGRSCVQFVTIS